MLEPDGHFWKQKNWLCPSCLEAILDNPTDKCLDCGGDGVDVREA